MKMRDRIKSIVTSAREELRELAEKMARLGYTQREISEELLYELLDRVDVVADDIDDATNTGILEEIDGELIRFALERIIKAALRRVEGRRTLGDFYRERRGGGMTTVPLRSGT